MHRPLIDRSGWIIVALVLVGVLIWLMLPAFAGYHVGYNAATDHECLIRLIQWCR